MAEILFWIFLFLVFYTYIGYGVLLWILVKIKEIFLKPKLKTTLCDELPDVTVLIIAYNEESYADSKMQNTLSLDYPAHKLNIIWVTDGSNDKTVDIISRYPQAKVLHESERRGKTAAMNRGMQYITTPLVIFTDANTIINTEAVKEIVEAFSDIKVGGVSGEKKVVSDMKDSATSSGEGFYWRYESKLKDLDARLYTLVGAAGELFAIRTELFEPMPENTLLDDFILSLGIAKKGYKIAYCKSAYAIEKGSLNMKEEEKRKVRIAAGGLRAICKLSSLLNVFRYRTLSFQYISHRVLRWTITPIALFLLFPLNLYLCTQSENHILYTTLLILQIIFYLTGLTGYYLATKNIKHKILFIPYYFLFMNINIFRGFSYLRRKKESGAWEKSERKA